MPRMIQPGRTRQTNLADDLGPEMQRGAGFAPCRGRQFRPRAGRRACQCVAHVSPLQMSLFLMSALRCCRHQKAECTPAKYTPICEVELRSSQASRPGFRKAVSPPAELQVLTNSCIQRIGAGPAICGTDFGTTILAQPLAAACAPSGR